eukprot:6405535-Ditylum_brightwellii.AAC.1
MGIGQHKKSVGRKSHLGRYRSIFLSQGGDGSSGIVEGELCAPQGDGGSYKINYHWGNAV